MGRIGQRAVESVSTNFRKFVNQWPSWRWLPQKLQAAGLEPTKAIELRTNDPRRSWIILAKPNDALVNHFDLAPEVLVLCSPWDDMQANDVGCAEDKFREEIRLDPGFALVVTGDVDAGRRLGRIVPENRRYIFISHQKLENALDPQAMLRAELRDALGQRKLFDMRGPADGRQFFGREKELEALERDVQLGLCLGIFGLRKVGKTSLLRRVAEKFRSTGQVIPIVADLQTLHFKKRDLAGLGAFLGAAFDRELESSRRMSVDGLPAEGFDRFEQAIARAQRDGDARVLLILDEYEVLLDGRIPVVDGLEFLTWLRGLAQSHAKNFSFILAGRNARFMMPARIDGRDNPMYRFLKTVRIAGLSPTECRTMVRKIGRRMALNFSTDALDILVEQTGGHPALTRTLGDLVDQAIPLAHRDPEAAQVDAILMKQILPRFSRNPGVIEDMQELISASNDVDKHAGAYLVHLAHTVPTSASPVEASIHDALVEYGILAEDPTTFRIGHLATWLRENYSNPLQAANG